MMYECKSLSLTRLYLESAKYFVIYKTSLGNLLSNLRLFPKASAEIYTYIF